MLEPLKTEAAVTQHSQLSNHCDECQQSLGCWGKQCPRKLSNSLIVIVSYKPGSYVSPQKMARVQVPVSHVHCLLPGKSLQLYGKQ